LALVKLNAKQKSAAVVDVKDLIMPLKRRNTTFLTVKWHFLSNLDGWHFVCVQYFCNYGNGALTESKLKVTAFFKFIKPTGTSFLYFDRCFRAGKY
jgi:hypothetical protein